MSRMSRMRGAAVGLRHTLTTKQVISGVGKGIIASSVGLPIRSMALKLTNIKIDPTINLDVAM
jgi:CTP synthase